MWMYFPLSQTWTFSYSWACLSSTQPCNSIPTFQASSWHKSLKSLKKKSFNNCICFSRFRALNKIKTIHDSLGQQTSFQNTLFTHNGRYTHSATCAAQPVPFCLLNNTQNNQFVTYNRKFVTHLSLQLQGGKKKNTKKTALKPTPIRKQKGKPYCKTTITHFL